MKQQVTPRKRWTIIILLLVGTLLLMWVVVKLSFLPDAIKKVINTVIYSVSLTFLLVISNGTFWQFRRTRLCFMMITMASVLFVVKWLWENV